MVDLNLSSLDLTVYAYLKEELVNTDDSAEMKYLKSNCPNLINFVNLMDFLFTEEDQENLPEQALLLKTEFFNSNRISLLNASNRKPSMSPDGGKLKEFDLSLHIDQCFNQLLQHEAPLKYSFTQGLWSSFTNGIYNKIFKGAQNPVHKVFSNP